MYLSFTNVVAASTTDALPLTIRVKGLVALQSVVSLAGSQARPAAARGLPGAVVATAAVTPGSVSRPSPGDPFLRRSWFWCAAEEYRVTVSASYGLRHSSPYNSLLLGLAWGMSGA